MPYCPICDSELDIATSLGVEIDFCPNGHGVWLDRGELDKIIDRASAQAGGRSLRDTIYTSEAVKKKRKRDYPVDDLDDVYDRSPRRRDWDDDDDDDDDRRRKKMRRRKKGFLEELFDIFD